MPRRSAASLHFPAFTRVERLTPPPDLSPDERALFVNIVATNPADHFRPSDAPLLCSYVRAVLLERKAAENLAAQGYVTVDNKASAWVAIQMQASKTLLQCARALKLSPTSRRPSASRAGKGVTMNYYDRMRLEDPDAADAE
jgi:phage terminase small subunit